jgi:hypothetical protein
MTSHRVTKLVNQYNQHNSLVIGVDFDFTLYDPETDTIHQELVDLLHLAQDKNCILCLWTANTERLQYIIGKCAQAGLYFSYINESPITIAGGSTKPHFNILLDDTAGLGQAIEILELTLKEIS